MFQLASYSYKLALSCALPCVLCLASRSMLVCACVVHAHTCTNARSHTCNVRMHRTAWLVWHVAAHQLAVSAQALVAQAHQQAAPAAAAQVASEKRWEPVHPVFMTSLWAAACWPDNGTCT